MSAKKKAPTKKKKTAPKPKRSVKPKAKKPSSAVPVPETVLVIRTCDKNLRSDHNGFQWPESGPISCHDFKPTKQCGNGLHGLLWGEGAGGYLDWSPDAKWLVVRVAVTDLVDLGDKCKFRCGEVVYCGDMHGAANYVYENGGAGKCIVGGTATAGYRGTATAGDRGTATAGDGGTATAGDGGTATAGYGGTATAGDGGAIQLDFFDREKRIYRKRCAEVGYNVGLKPNTKYRLNENAEFVEVES